MKSTTGKKHPSAKVLMGVILFMTINGYSQNLKVNDLEYFESPGVNVLVFSSEYNGMFFDEKTAGIEIIHHGVRTSTGGAIRLQNTPEQWDLIPRVVDRRVDQDNNSIEVTLRYEEFNFESRVVVAAKEKGIAISVYLDEPVPEKLRGRAGFNMEFLPPAYFEKSYLMDGKPGTFPLYPAGETNMEPVSKKIPQYEGHTTFDDRGRGEYINPHPLVTGKTIILAPEDPERYVKIQSEDADLMLFDGRNLAQNGWFIVRSVLPSAKSGNVLNWYVEPYAIPDWKRSPVIAFSQVGYHPDREKVAIIELDSRDEPLKTASLFKVTPDGKTVKELSSEIQVWGKYFRYNYVRFDFSSVTEPGVYFIEYGDERSNTFLIDKEVYKNIGNPTLDIWFPVQMDHMTVNEGYRIWHGTPFLDDALQAPTNIQFYDGYSMGPTTDTRYKPLERIPGLAVGGWFDAGDFDIQTGTHCSTILSLVDIWEGFKLDRDQTFIDQKTRYVDMHRPDGKPDILQQIEHGTLNLVAQVKNIGHPVRGIIVPNLHLYHHLGDASTETDNLPYNPELKPYETDGKSSGTMDDRWAFTNRNPMLDYSTCGALAASYRALKDYNEELADESLELAQKLWEETNNLNKESQGGSGAFWRRSSELTAVLQLYISTKDERYKQKFNEIIWPSLDGALNWTLSVGIRAIPYMDKDYQTKLGDYVIKYKESVEGLARDNPYGVPMIARGWGGNGTIINWAITNYYACKAFPDIIEPESVFKGLNYVLGCHPYSNLSFVSAVGTRSKKVAYGNNRADFSFIAGGVVPGLLLLTPDFYENKEDWPFLWGENEYTVGIGASYILLTQAVNDLVNENK